MAYYSHLQKAWDALHRYAKAESGGDVPKFIELNLESHAELAALAITAAYVIMPIEATLEEVTAVFEEEVRQRIQRIMAKIPSQ